MKPSRLAWAAAPLIALSVAACGTASSTQPPRAAASATPTASAAARFAAAADRICAVQNQREAALGNGLINADIVSVAHLPKAAHYLDKVVAIRRDGLPELRQLAAAGPAADQAEQEAFVQAYQKVITDYQDAAQAASQGNMTAFRADFSRVAPHGYPTGPDARALDRAAAPFPFKACGMSNGP
ncbi:MAG: hypothetical protein JO132_20905 [Streptosporangiaceae bacterium]|nr:hypothetical protein [Streptosporangiaceae bacterium]